MKSNLMRRLSILLVLALVLSMLPIAAMAADTTTIYLKPGDWEQGDAWYQAWVWGAGDQWVTATDADADGVYEFEVPTGTTNMIILRKGPDHAEGDWTCWNRTNDQTIGDNNCVTITGWGGAGTWNEVSSGTWEEDCTTEWSVYTPAAGGEVEETTEPEVTEPEVVEPVETITVYVDTVTINIEGAVNAYAWDSNDSPVLGAWPGTAMTQVEGNIYSIEVPVTAANIIFNNKVGDTGVQTGDLEMPAATGYVWNGTDWVDYATYTPSGAEVVTYTYYVAGSFNGWSNPDVNYGMTDTDGDGVYTITFPLTASADVYSLKVTDGGWTNCWGGTGAGGNYEFEVTSDCDVTVTFDSNAKTVTVTGAGIPTVSYPPYVVVGNVLGLEGDANWSAANGVEMTTADDGVTYTYTFSALAVSPDAETPYEFKIVKDGTTWLPDGDNWKFYVINEASDVTITIVAETAQISINTGDNVVFDYPGTETPITIETVVVAGGPTAESGTTNMGNLLYGVEWNPAQSLNAMALVDGVYVMEYLNVPAGSYDIKFAANSVDSTDWTHSWGAGTTLTSGTAATAYYGGGNCTIVVDTDGSAVKFILDLSTVVNAGDNGTVTVEITAPEGLESSAPDSLVIGSNDFVLGTGDRNVVSSTFTATEDCTLTVNVAAMNAFNGAEMESIPGFFIGMQFGNRYGIVIDGVYLYSVPQTVELTAGQTVEIGFVSYMGNAAELTVVLCDEHNWSDGYCLNCNAACEHAEATHDAANLTVTCATCGKSVTYTGNAIKLNTATLSLADDISVNFHCTVPAEYWSAYVVFTFNGEETYVYDYTLNEDNGRFIFSFPGVLPQTMGDDIGATLYVNIEGMNVAVETSYSVIRYCNSQLKKTTISDEFRTLISDLLAYGAQAQIYTSDTDTLVTDLVEYEMTPSTFPGLDASFNQQAFDESVDKDTANRFASVALQLENKVVVRLGIVIADPANSTVEVTIGGETYTYSITELEYNETNGRYYLNFDQVAATQFNEKITCVLKTNDAQVGQVLYYSVNSYVYKNQDKGTVEATLLQLIYNYGKAAEEYAASL